MNNNVEKLEDIRRYLDADLHPVVSPDRWDVYASLCDMVDEIIALLKAQEPRVMSMEEAKAVEGYAWLECCDTDILRVSLFHNGFYIEPFERPLRADLMNWTQYNKQWRYWTSCPTKEQMEATPWSADGERRDGDT